MTEIARSKVTLRDASTFSAGVVACIAAERSLDLGLDVIQAVRASRGQSKSSDLIRLDALVKKTRKEKYLILETVYICPLEN